MMRQKLFISAIYLITTLFIFLIACEALKEDQSSERARVLCGNIPFNGGMFGKRSAPDLCKPSHVNEGEEYVDSDIEYAAEAEKYDGSAIRNSAPNPNMSQDESPVQASIHRCARALRSPGKSPNQHNL